MVWNWGRQRTFECNMQRPSWGENYSITVAHKVHIKKTSVHFWVQWCKRNKHTTDMIRRAWCWLQQVGDCVMLWGCILLAWTGSTWVFWKNHKINMKLFWDGRSHLLDCSARANDPTCMRMMSISCYGLICLQIWTQISFILYRRVKTSPTPSSKQEIREFPPDTYLGHCGTWQHITSLRHPMLVLPLMCHPSADHH